MKLILSLLLAAIPYIESIEVTVHNVDVIVTDRAGNRVHGLQKSDFELLENNAPQAISNFSEYRGTERAPVATTEPAPLPQPRKFVMLFDELSLHPDAVAALKRQTGELVEATMQPGDELMMLTPMSKNAKVALPFSSDKRAIHDAIESVMRQSGFRADTELVREQVAFDSSFRGVVPSSQRASEFGYTFGVTRRVRRTLGYLQAIVTALAEVPGKKSIIFITQSLPSESPYRPFDMAPWASLQSYLADIARTASSNGITIYCLQPDLSLGGAIGDIVGGPRPHAGPGSNFAQYGRPWTPTFQLTTRGTQVTFEMLTKTTGGKWWRGGAGIEPLFHQVAEDATDYYSLGYRATAEVPDRTRSIAVRVRDHPEYDVRSRRAVVRKSAPNEMRDLTIAQLVDEHPIDELGASVSAGTPHRQLNGDLLLPVDVKVPLSKLTFLRDGEVYRATFRVHYAAESSSFDFAPGEGREQIVEVPSADMPTIGGKFFTYTSSLRVRKGEVKVAVGVLDPLSRLATIKTMTVEAR